MITLKSDHETLEKRINELEKELRQCWRTSQSVGEAEATARALLNATSESAILIDTKGIILAANEVTVHRLKMLNVNIIRKKIQDVLPTDVAKQLKNKINKVKSSGEPMQFENESDGRLYANTIYPVFGRQAKVEKLAIYTRDITVEKRAVEALKESEEKFRSISASAQDALVMMNSSGNISYWNEAAERIFGHTKKEAIGKNLHQLLVPKRYLEAFTAGFGGFKETGQGSIIGKTTEMRALRKDETEFFMELSLSSFKLHSQWHALGVIRDISDRKQAEKERLQREKLQGVLEMAGAACHELNQPLQIISGYYELLIKDIPNDRSVGANFKLIQEQIDKMGEITKKIMKITKYETRPYTNGSKIIDIDKSSSSGT